MVLITEATRQDHIQKSKNSLKGKERFNRRLKSKVTTQVKNFNDIDMNNLFKKGIFTIGIDVQGETDKYVVKISFGNFLDLLHKQIKHEHRPLDLKMITKVLVQGFNSEDVLLNCSCPDANYRYNYFQNKNGIATDNNKETRPSNITNPNDSLGTGCKHVLLVLNHSGWILKASTTIYNYINYMEKHQESLYAKFIFPAIYETSYDKAYQLDIFADQDNLDTDKETIDKSNDYARNKQKFKPGNKQGIRFQPNSKTQNQMEIDLIDDN